MLRSMLKMGYVMTEIFGTLGPACAQADLLEKMFLEGMTVCG
ncbi:hypothetical protein C823_000007 [Eubacterium plexicaudatum ASF492]|nr:hypothetical protein C823_000007 [Eubacterium plexicaudatum ASF492]